MREFSNASTSPSTRALRLVDLVRKADEKGVVSGRIAEIPEAVQAETDGQWCAPNAMSIDGATAVVFCKFSAAALARSYLSPALVGVLAHGREQMHQGGRNKGPRPPGHLPACEEANANE